MSIKGQGQSLTLAKGHSDFKVKYLTGLYTQVSNSGPHGLLVYFSLSSEIMENISAIKVISIYSEMIWYHFTVD